VEVDGAPRSSRHATISTLIAVTFYALPFLPALLISEPLRLGVGCTLAAVSIWCLVRWLNRLDDPLHVKHHRNTP
jgi:hypothetical protein